MIEKQDQKMPHKVLIVDDEPVITDMLKDVLSTEPYEILSSSSGEEALETLAKENVDVVISDEKMPGMTGSEFLAVVRKEFPDTIRMILTGHASLEAAIRSINEGKIYRFFTKPCNVFDLAVTIRQALQQKELMKKSRGLLRMVQRQSAFIESLESRYPGITKVRKDARGDVIMEDEKNDRSLDKLMDEIGQILDRYEKDIK